MNYRYLLSRTAGKLAASLLPASAANTKPKTVWGVAELWQWLYEKQQTRVHDSATPLLQRNGFTIRADLRDKFFGWRSFG